MITKKAMVIYSILICSIFLISMVSAQTTATVTISGTIAAHKPVADFIGSPTNGTFPLKVEFTDNSLYSPTTWKWEYKTKNDNWVRFSNKQNPDHTFQQGTYDIRLTVSNEFGSNTTVKKEYIVVSDRQKKPVARFTAIPFFGKAPLDVRFKDESSFKPISYLWEFGDGTTSTLESPPLHTYTHTGMYNVQLTVTNAAGTDTTGRYVFVLQNWWWNGWGNPDHVEKSDHKPIDDYT